MRSTTLASSAATSEPSRMPTLAAASRSVPSPNAGAPEPVLTVTYTSAGAIMPPPAAATGSAARRGSRRSPATNSRLSSRPATKKKTASSRGAPNAHQSQRTAAAGRRCCWCVLTVRTRTTATCAEGPSWRPMSRTVPPRTRARRASRRARKDRQDARRSRRRSANRSGRPPRLPGSRRQQGRLEWADEFPRLSPRHGSSPHKYGCGDQRGTRDLRRQQCRCHNRGARDCSECREIPPWNDKPAVSRTRTGERSSVSC